MTGEDMSRQVLADIIDSIEDGAAIYDADDRLVQFNEKYTQYFQLAHDILKPGVSFREIFQTLARRGLYEGPESGLEDWVAGRVKLFTEGTRGNEFQRVDGRWVRVDYYKLQAGGTFVITADITERRKAEKALELSHERLELMVEARTADLHAAYDFLRTTQARLTDAIESITDGFIYYDSDRRLVLCNDKYREFYPWIDDALIPGARLEDIARTAAERGQDADPIEDVDAWVATRLEMFESGCSGHVQHLRDGRWLLCSESRTSDGGYVGIRSDITEHRRTEAQLRQAQKMEAVGQLTGGVAHDFNNLLAVIQGNAELLAENRDVDPSLTEPIVRAAERGAELTQRLLAFSRQQNLVARPIDPGELLSGLSDLLDRTIGETIEVEIGHGAAQQLWKALADRSQLETALLNLALNARDAMPEGGRLAITCANAVWRPADVAENPETIAGDYLQLTVSDNGTGMSDETRARAFEPFFTTKDVGKGSGLGLSMVYGFAKQSGGHVTLWSAPGRGTTVKLYLPRARRPDRPEARSADEAIPEGRGETILVIEDDPQVRSMTTRLLGGLGYKSIDVSTAAEARRILADGHRVDMLLSDMVLPGGISGPAFAEEARAAYPGLKVAFMSGYPADPASGGGAVDADTILLAKPFQRHQLAKALRRTLDR